MNLPQFLKVNLFSQFHKKSETADQFSQFHKKKWKF